MLEYDNDIKAMHETDMDIRINQQALESLHLKQITMAQMAQIEASDAMYKACQKSVLGPIYDSPYVGNESVKDMFVSIGKAILYIYKAVVKGLKKMFRFILGLDKRNEGAIIALAGKINDAVLTGAVDQVTAIDVKKSIYLSKEAITGNELVAYADRYANMSGAIKNILAALHVTANDGQRLLNGINGDDDDPINKVSTLNERVTDVKEDYRKELYSAIFKVSNASPNWIPLNERYYLPILEGISGKGYYLYVAATNADSKSIDGMEVRSVIARESVDTLTVSRLEELASFKANKLLMGVMLKAINKDIDKVSDTVRKDAENISRLGEDINVQSDITAELKMQINTLKVNLTNLSKTFLNDLVTIVNAVRLLEMDISLYVKTLDGVVESINKKAA